MIRNILLVLLFIACRNIANSQREVDSLLNQLDQTIKEHKKYAGAKELRIDSLKNLLQNPGISYEQSYQLNNNLYQEYSSYKFDSAIHYLNKNILLSEALQQTEWLNETKLDLSNILTFSGMFKESIDILNSVDKKQVPKRLLTYYYFCYEQVYNKLSLYANDIIYAPDYKRKGRAYRDSALLYTDPTSNNYFITLAVSQVEDGELEKAKKIFSELLSKVKPESGTYPVLAALMADVCQKEGKIDLQKKFLIISAISDIKSAKKENTALRELAILLYQNGEIERAYNYVKFALEDAIFFGARQRVLEITKIQPIIDEAYQRAKERQQAKLRLYLVLISVLSLFLIAALFYIYKQMQKLSIAHKDLNKANCKLNDLNQDLQNVNNRLQELNIKLQDVNNKLIEANKIKEEYIGYFFNIDSNLFLKINKLISSIDKKIIEGKTEEIKFIVNKFNLKKEKEDVLINFDTVVLKLFPDFVQQFNALFKPEDQIKLKDGQLLNTELRIFALIRMGITENEKIAQILEYSVNTIYTYKTKIRNKSVVPNEEFEDRIMAIKTF